jgi:hypothetical protein
MATYTGPRINGGVLVYRRINDASENAINVKATAGQVYGWYLFNATTVTRYFKLYDKASTPSSSDTPLMTIPIPAGAAANVFMTHGIAHTNGIGFRIVTGMADSDATAPSANQVVINLLYY